VFWEDSRNTAQVLRELPLISKRSYVQVATAPLICVMLTAAAPNPPPAKPIAAERLSMPLFPSGWVEARTQHGKIEIVEYVPEGQTSENWQEKITLEVYYELNSMPLDALQRRALAQTRDSCDGVIEGKFQTGMNNGYPAAFWTMGCKALKGTSVGETRYTKAVQGGLTLYMLSRAWRTPVYGDEGPQIPPRSTEDAMAFLTTAVVCVPNNAEHPCPQGAPATTP